jgi:hypothetical protein
MKIKRTDRKLVLTTESLRILNAASLGTVAAGTIIVNTPDPTIVPTTERDSANALKTTAC